MIDDQRPFAAVAIRIREDILVHPAVVGKEIVESEIVRLGEELAAVHNLADILTVDNIDVFFVAPSDLAQTMGHIGNHTHPEVQAVIDQALAQILAAGRTAGTLVNDDNVERYLAAGVRFLMTGWTNWVAQGARAYLQRTAAKSVS